MLMLPKERIERNDDGSTVIINNSGRIVKKFDSNDNLIYDYLEKEEYDDYHEDTVIIVEERWYDGITGECIDLKTSILEDPAIEDEGYTRPSIVVDEKIAAMVSDSLDTIKNVATTLPPEAVKEVYEIMPILKILAGEENKG